MADRPRHAQRWNDGQSNIQSKRFGLKTLPPFCHELRSLLLWQTGQRQTNLTATQTLAFAFNGSTTTFSNVKRVFSVLRPSWWENLNKARGISLSSLSLLPHSLLGQLLLVMLTILLALLPGEKLQIHLRCLAFLLARWGRCKVKSLWGHCVFFFSFSLSRSFRLWSGTHCHAEARICPQESWRECGPHLFWQACLRLVVPAAFKK